MTTVTRTTIIAFLFVLSGLIGLLYQVAWFKYLALFIGNTTYAQAIVLATFMGGMAIGAWWWGRRADRTADPLRLYAWMEVAIGLFCAAYPVLIGFLREAFISVLSGAGWSGETPGVLSAKLVVSALSLLPPTILMGGTLPVLVRAVSVRLEDSGRTVATLYALNSLGAVVGAGLAGFFAVRLIGLERTVLLSAVGSIAVGAAAWWLSRSSPAPETPGEAAEGSGEVYPAPTAFAAIVVAGLSGTAAMMLEVVWVRMLIPVLGSSTYSFSLMLVAFISGITLGGLYVAGLLRRPRNLVALLAAAQAACVVALALTLPLYDRIPYLFWDITSVLTRSDSTYPLFLVLQFLFGFLWMFLPTFCFGISLPLAIRIAARSAETLGGSVGLVYTVNTFGTVAGSLLAAFVLIPAAGLAGTSVVAMGLCAAGAVVMTVRMTQTSRVRRSMVVAALSAGFVIILLFRPDARTPALTGVFRLINKNIEPPPTYEQFLEVYGRPVVRYYKEGGSVTVGVVESPSPLGPENVLIINGKSDASSRGDIPTQALLGQLPALMHGAPRSVMIIGYGSGVTAGSVLTHPVERVDCVEISPEVLEAAALFDDVNGKPRSDPRFRIVVDDALTALALAPEPYDVIISEPSNPWIAGIGNLYSREFFELCRRKLRPGGILSQWFHVYEMDDETFAMVLRTFASVFPHVTVWEPMSADVILLGSDRPFDVADAGLAERMGRPDVRRDLRRLDITRPATLLSLQMMSDHTVRSYAGDGPVNTEDLPALEYAAPRAFFVNSGVSNIDRYDERLSEHRPDTYLVRRVRGGHPLDDAELREAGLLHTSYNRGHPLVGYFLLRDLVSRHPKDVGVLGALARVTERLGKPEERLEYLRMRTVATPGDPAAHAAYGWERFAFDTRTQTTLGGVATAEAEAHIRKAIALSGDTVDTYRVQLADLFYATGRFRLAMDQYARAIHIRERFARDPYIFEDRILARIAICLHREGEPERALGFALQATQLNPQNEEARDLIHAIWTAGGKTPDAPATGK